MRQPTGCRMVVTCFSERSWHGCSASIKIAHQNRQLRCAKKFLLTFFGVAPITFLLLQGQSRQAGFGLSQQMDRQNQAISGNLVCANSVPLIRDAW